MADSRPLPGPCTRTCTLFTPAVSASRAHCSAATVAANGVLFLEPLNPALPLEPHAIVLPRGSVMVTVVLLKVALTWAMPSASTTFLVFFPIAIGLLGYLLLPGDRAARALLGTRIGVRALTADRKSTTVTGAAVGADIHQSLDVHRDFRAQRPFDAILLLDHLTELVPVGVAQVADPQRCVDPRRFHDFQGGRTSDPEDIGQSDLNLLVLREIDARNTSHSLSALTLLMLRIALADDASHALALDNLAVLTNRLHAASDFHSDTIIAKREIFRSSHLE